MVSPTRHLSDEPAEIDPPSAESSSRGRRSRSGSIRRDEFDNDEEAPLSPLPDFERKERQGSIIPEFTADVDNDEVDVHLSHVRRRSTLLHRHRRKKSEHLGNLEEPHTDLDLGEETAAERAEREIMDNLVDEEERANQGISRQAVSIKAYDMDWNEWGEDEEDGVKMKNLPSGFAWDVIFENQRGIHIFGKAYFSSNSLLPADPSAYTVPSHALPTATSLTISSPSGTASHGKKQKTTPLSFARGVASSSHNIVHRNPTIPAEFKSYEANTQINLGPNRDTRTAYTLDTAQCPDPTWEWVTPWMINMKTGTDEGGWRYNAWFRKSGWKPHAGTAGWAGWVRRREWVRLRSVKQERELRKHDDEEHGAVSAAPPDVSERPVEGILTAMGKMMVDREKLAAWDKWLQDDVFRDTVTPLFDDQEARDRIRDGFTYTSHFDQLASRIRPSLASSDDR